MDGTHFCHLITKAWTALGIFTILSLLLFYLFSPTLSTHIFSNLEDVVMDRRHSARLIPLWSGLRRGMKILKAPQNREECQTTGYWKWKSSSESLQCGFQIIIFLSDDNPNATSRAFNLWSKSLRAFNDFPIIILMTFPSLFQWLSNNSLKSFDWKVIGFQNIISRWITERNSKSTKQHF